MALKLKERYEKQDIQINMEIVQDPCNGEETADFNQKNNELKKCENYNYLKIHFIKESRTRIKSIN